MSTASFQISFVNLRKKVLSKGTSGLLIRGAASSFAVQVIGTATAFAAQVVLTRLLGAEQYGYYIYVLTWLSLMALLSKLGMDTTLVRYVAAYRATNNWPAFRGLFLSSNRIATGSSTLVAAVIALGIMLFGQDMEPELVRTFYIGCLVLPFITLSVLRRAALRGLKAVVWAQLPDVFIRPVLMSAFLIGWWLLSTRAITGHMAMLLQLIAVAISFLIGAYILAKKLPAEARSVEPEYHTREWVLYALPLLLFSGMHLILNKMDTVMIGMLMDTTQAGLYSVGVKLSDVIVFGLTAVNMIAAPTIAGLYAEKRFEDLQRMLTVAARGIFAYTAVVSIVIIAAGEFLLGIFGPQFPAAYRALVMLVVGQLFNALAGSVGYLMTMTGNQNVALVVLVISALINVVLNFVMIPLWGMLGAALATAVSTVFWNLCLVVYARRKLGLKTTIF